MTTLKAICKAREFGLFCLLAVICLAFGIIDENFRDPYNFLDRTRQWVEIGILAVPMTFIIATAGIDLSVGSLLALCSIVAGLCFRDMGCSLPVALLAGVIMGAVGGAFNGLMVSLFRIPALVVTLATLAMFRGLAMGLSQANPIRGFPEGFTDWGSLSSCGWGDWQLPYQTLILLVITLVGVIVFRKTRLGR
jgi:rhamnose transport system permease protein